MELKRIPQEIIHFPILVVSRIGQVVTEMVSSGPEFAQKLQEEEPRSRAISAIEGAQRAMIRADEELLAFEALRAALAAEAITNRSGAIHMQDLQAVNQVTSQIETIVPVSRINDDIRERVETRIGKIKNQVIEKPIKIGANVIIPAQKRRTH